MLFDKAKIHVQYCALAWSPKAVFNRMLCMLNRRISLPKTVLEAIELDRPTRSERHLLPYMFPRHGGCFVDVGANIGSWTFWVAKQGVDVHAFEPTPSTYQILEKHSRRRPRIYTYQYALGETEYDAELNICRGSGHNSLETESSDFTGRVVLVHVKTLDSWAFENVGLVKIDTEGYEYPILLGSKDTIRRCEPRLVIEVHLDYQEQKSRILGLLKEIGYQWIIRYKSAKGQPHIIADPRST